MYTHPRGTYIIHLYRRIQEAGCGRFLVLCLGVSVLQICRCVAVVAVAVAVAADETPRVMRTFLFASRDRLWGGGKKKRSLVTWYINNIRIFLIFSHGRGVGVVVGGVGVLCAV